MLTTYLPPFKRAIIDGGAHSIMSAYSAYDGVPAVADKYMLTDILRDSWGYKYFVSFLRQNGNNGLQLRNYRL